MRAWRGIEGLEDPRALKAWLARISVFTARGVIRGRRRRRWLSFVPELPDPEPAWAGSDLRDAARAVYSVLDRMAPDQRIPFALRTLEGMDLESTAAACGVSLSTARRRLAKAEKRFYVLAREYPALEPWVGGGDPAALSHRRALARPGHRAGPRAGEVPGPGRGVRDADRAGERPRRASHALGPRSSAEGRRVAWGVGLAGFAGTGRGGGRRDCRRRDHAGARAPLSTGSRGRAWRAWADAGGGRAQRFAAAVLRRLAGDVPGGRRRPRRAPDRGRRRGRARAEERWKPRSCTREPRAGLSTRVPIACASPERASR